MHGIAIGTPLPWKKRLLFIIKDRKLQKSSLNIDLSHKVERFISKKLMNIKDLKWVGF